MSDPIQPAPSSTPSQSSTGLESHIAGLLCYLLGFITAIVFLVIEKQDRTVRFHAYQSLATFGAIFVISMAAGVIPLVGLFISLLLTPVSLILWILLMVKAAQGERFKLPVVGDWAEQQAQAA